MADPIHSTGRGGAGNIGPDHRVYADGSIIHEGVAGDSSKPEFSTGRGGAGNIIDSPSLRAAKRDGSVSGPPLDQDVIPETALREAQADFHTGRGGEGNVHRDKFGGHSSDQTRKGSAVGEMLKGILHLGGKKEGEKKKENGVS